MLDKKISEYKRDIALAKSFKKHKYADQGYYNELISKFEKLLNFYEKLKQHLEVSDVSNAFQIEITSWKFRN